MLSLARLIAPALVCAASLAAHADSINFSLTGGDGTFSFSLPSTAEPTSSNSVEAVYSLASATGGGYTVLNDTLYFYTPGAAGGLSIQNSKGVVVLDEYGPQVFSGNTSSPVFRSGTYTFTNGTSSINGTSSAATGDILTISVSPSTSPVPEPSTLALFGTGVLSLAGVARRVLQA